MYIYLLYFLIFSFLGWFAEVLFSLVTKRRLINRGLLFGPVCPIYGIGICLSKLILGSVVGFIPLMLLSMAIATIVEFMVGVVCERITGKRLWDYRNERGNILGYVCPRFSLLWGIVSSIVIITLRRIDGYVALSDTLFTEVALLVILTILLIDAGVSLFSDKRKNKTINPINDN